MKVAIIDCIGLDYDGTTLEKRGIGGSESSIISISRELVKLGIGVTIYNNCNSEDTNPGFYDGVEYRDLYQLDKLDKRKYDVVISQRTVIPFTPQELFDEVRQPFPRDIFKPEWFEHFQDPSIHKVLWMQDTFIWGDHLLEGLVVNGKINEIFNLSDWHIAYTTNCIHGPRRIYEVLKPHIFHTRNGINRYIDEVDIVAKDPNLFVYNASVTKGMIPLVMDIWPRIQEQLPDARLKIVGGYYDFKNEEDTPYKKQWQELNEAVKYNPTIEFTGIIPQPEIAKLLAKASFTIYPGAYPETSGISILESINYNTPVIGTRFGAMNETGTEYAGYYIDYGIEPNVLAPWVNKEAQVQKFVDLTVAAYHNKYLHQQKMYACNAAKEVSTWDTIALQWKQHFALTVGKCKMSKEEFDKVDWINYRVHKVFERRFSNPVEYESNQLESIELDLVAPLKQHNLSVAIIDLMGMAYDGSTLEKRGIGGSEAAVIQMARELQKIGFDVTVYNACDEEACQPSFYSKVEYLPLSDLGNKSFDIVISSRAVTPFVPADWNFEQTLNRKIDQNNLHRLQNEAKLKVVWLHDTFCQDGDHVIEDLITHGHIDEVWTLSDFHNNYFQYCKHPRLRIPEVLRNHTWITRNGMRKSDYQFDISKKDQNLFVFNANRSKGLKPLLRSVWPKVKQKLPDAQLVVIGGYYNLGKAYGDNSDEEQDFFNLVNPYKNDQSIKFTGIITNDEVYKHLENASYLLYPTDQPETFSISTLEALYHNLTVISTNFAAMEEIGSPQAFQINYSSSPNALKHDINEDTQAEKLAELAYDAWCAQTLIDNCRRTELQELDRIKPIAGWDTVALEWKQHLYTKLGIYLSATESTRALYTKNQWQKIFGRRTSTPEQWMCPQIHNEEQIVVISPFYNAKAYIEKCIHSVAAQMYKKYIHILIDDCSTDGSYREAKRVIANLPESIRSKFKLIRNKQNKGAVYNQITQIRNNCSRNDIVMLLDGDDSLVNRPDLFNYYNELHQTYDFTYGSCWSEADKIPLVGQPYPKLIRNSKTYRDHKFNWAVPYTHLRTFKAHLLINESDQNFMNQDGEWFKAGGDLSVFYTALENCDPKKVYAVPDLVYNYNDQNPLNDYKINADEQNKTVQLLTGTSMQPQRKRILIAIPCKNDIQADTFKSIYDLEIPDGFETEFQYFYGYAIAQVRNLIANWMVNGPYDYLLAVDHDMILPKDTLIKMIQHDKDFVSGVYRQRLPEQHIELYDSNYVRLPIENVTGDLLRIGASGFGCVLIKKQVFQKLTFPHFEYHENPDSSKIFSEDVDFCKKANEAGFELYADTSILCGHIGEQIYTVELAKNPIKERLRDLSKMDLLPKKHIEFLEIISKYPTEIKTIYDIGACVLHWTNKAKTLWPNATFVAFEAMNECEFLYQEKQMPYVAGALLYHTDNVELDFYQNLEHPGGNSIYRENEQLSPDAKLLFTDDQKVRKKGMKLDTLVEMFDLPPPDLIKMDIQGAELDALKGADKALKTVKYLIIELQKEDYNVGAPKFDEVKSYLKTRGFSYHGHISGGLYDADCFFVQDSLVEY